MDNQSNKILIENTNLEDTGLISNNKINTSFRLNNFNSNLVDNEYFTDAHNLNDKTKKIKDNHKNIIAIILIFILILLILLIIFVIDPISNNFNYKSLLKEYLFTNQVSKTKQYNTNVIIMKDLNKNDTLGIIKFPLTKSNLFINNSNIFIKSVDENDLSKYIPISDTTSLKTILNYKLDNTLIKGMNFKKFFQVDDQIKYELNTQMILDKNSYSMFIISNKSYKEIYNAKKILYSHNSKFNDFTKEEKKQYEDVFNNLQYYTLTVFNISDKEKPVEDCINDGYYIFGALGYYDYSYITYFTDMDLTNFDKKQLNLNGFINYIIRVVDNSGTPDNIICQDINRCIEDGYTMIWKYNDYVLEYKYNESIKLKDYSILSAYIYGRNYFDYIIKNNKNMDLDMKSQILLKYKDINFQK